MRSITINNLSHKQPSTVNSLSEEFHVDARTAKRWLEDAKIDAGETEKACAEFERRKKLSKHPMRGEDKENTLAQQKLAQEVRKLTRENNLAQRLEDKTVMMVSDVEKMMTTGIGKIELVMPKLASEFSLPPEVIARGTQLFDEAREAWAKGLPVIP